MYIDGVVCIVDADDERNIEPNKMTTYRITRKKFLFQALSGVALWWLFNQMKSPQYTRHTLHDSLDTRLQSQAVLTVR